MQSDGGDTCYMAHRTREGNCFIPWWHLLCCS